MRHSNLHGYQSGAVLIISLIMLVLLSIIGMASMRGTLLEERMSGNLRDSDLALQAAEAALREGEAIGTAVSGAGSCAADGGFDGSDGCYSNSRDCIDADTTNNDACWPARNAPAAWTGWAANGRSITRSLPTVATQPSYVLEQDLSITQKKSDSLKATEESETWTYFRVTARGVGGNPNTTAVVQSTYLSIN